MLSSLLGYLEWGKDQHIFLFDVEKEIFIKILTSPSSVIHPFILLPLVGQFILIYSILNKEVSVRLTYIGMSLIAILLVFMFFIGLISLNSKILISCIPFLLISFIIIKHNRAK